MGTTYVAVDVETTGLDPARDAIIEVAAITFRDAAILDEFDSLVNPLVDIPPFITQLTSITDDMVTDAPTLHTLRPKLRGKLGDNVLVGHNVEFDLGFLREARLAFGNRRIDTLTLASILAPEAGRFSLSSLADFLNLPSNNGRGHRARGDAELTIELFLALRERALALSLGLVSTAIAYVFHFRAVETVGSAYTSIFSTFEPIMTVVMAFAVLGEDIVLLQIAGVLLIVAGIVMPNLREWRAMRLLR